MAEPGNRKLALSLGTALIVPSFVSMVMLTFDAKLPRGCPAPPIVAKFVPAPVCSLNGTVPKSASGRMPAL
jgi:hypothetical protein